jgi:hypothetical protein
VTAADSHQLRFDTRWAVKSVVTSRRMKVAVICPSSPALVAAIVQREEDSCDHKASSISRERTFLPARRLHRRPTRVLLATMISTVFRNVGMSRCLTQPLIAWSSQFPRVIAAFQPPVLHRDSAGTFRPRGQSWSLAFASTTGADTTTTDDERRPLPAKESLADEAEVKAAREARK